MLIKVNLDNDLFKQIQKLVNDGKYQDAHQFIRLALNNQIQEEISGIEQNDKQLILFDEPTTEEVQTIDMSRPSLEINIEETPPQESEIHPEKQDLIWSFYNRFFPVKVVVYQLARLISPTKPWIELGELQEAAFIFAESVSAKLKANEQDFQLSRNKKLSTGLPSPKYEIYGYKGNMRRQKEAKFQSSKLRFMEQIVGKPIKKDPPSFKGACFSLGLIAVRFAGDTCKVSLTKLGKEFALIKNPIIAQEKFERALSKEETEFILEKIIPKFDLENRIVKKIIISLKKRELSSNEIDVIFEEEKMKHFESLEGELSSKRKNEIKQSIVQERVATMGRLSELQVVNWEIDKEGKSIYSLA